MPASDQHADNDRHEERIAQAQMRYCCLTQIACQQDGAEEGSLGNHIEGRAQQDRLQAIATNSVATAVASTSKGTAHDKNKKTCSCT